MVGVQFGEAGTDTAVPSAERRSHSDTLSDFTESFATGTAVIDTPAVPVDLVTLAADVDTKLRRLCDGIRELNERMSRLRGL